MPNVGFVLFRRLISLEPLKCVEISRQEILTHFEGSFLGCVFHRTSFDASWKISSLNFNTSRRKVLNLGKEVCRQEPGAASTPSPAPSVGQKDSKQKKAPAEKPKAAPVPKSSPPVEQNVPPPVERKDAAPMEPKPTVVPKHGGCEGPTTAAAPVEPVAAPLKSKVPMAPSLLALAVRRQHLQEKFLGIFHVFLAR